MAADSVVNTLSAMRALTSAAQPETGRGYRAYRNVLCGSAMCRGSKHPALIGTSGKMCLIARYTAAFVVAITLLSGPRQGGLDSEKSKCRSVPLFFSFR